MLTARVLARSAAFGCLAGVVLLAPAGYADTGGGWPSPYHPAELRPATRQAAEAQGLGSLTELGLDPHAGPVELPIELRIPSLGVIAPVVGVGVTALNAMDAPKGPAGDPVWQEAFWYRGSGIPGEAGTAIIAGHVDDVLGQPAVFARLAELRPGDLIVIHDERSGLGVRFTVADAETYSIQQAADQSVLARIYGSGPVAGRGPEPAADGRAHLTLITCAGDFVNGSYDHWLVVYSTRNEGGEQRLLQPGRRQQACPASTDRSSPCW